MSKRLKSRATLSLMTLLTSVIGLGLNSCARPASKEQASARSDETMKRFPATSSISWSTCSLVTGSNDGKAECAIVPMPLDWNQPSGRKISYFMKRVVGSSQGPHKQIWLISGGPGAAGVGFESTVQGWSKFDPSLDFYIPDHRGTGNSERLACPNTEGVQYNFNNPVPPQLWPTCLSEVIAAKGQDYVQFFSITNAAKDIEAAIELNRQPEQDVDVLGVSYGTVLTQRYLQIAPDQANAVIIQGFSAAGVLNLDKWDYYHNDVVKKIFKTCESDSTCHEKLGSGGSTPWEKLGQLLRELQANPQKCVVEMPDEKGGTFKDPITYASVRAWLALYADVNAVRDTLPAVIYRVNRCSSEDQKALSLFRTNFFVNTGLASTSGNYVAAEGSEVLQNIITSSELIALPVDKAAVQAEDKALYASAGMEILFSEIADESTSNTTLPASSYPRDRYFGQYPSVKQPMLLMNGTLDPSTPFVNAKKVAKVYLGQSNKHYFFSIPRDGHVGAPNFDDAGNPSCVQSIVQAFISNPQSKPNASCLNKEPELDFSHKTDGMPQKMFGRNDLWE
jgi:pimeloyl-ACP methyl ester carboxylesterase